MLSYVPKLLSSSLWGRRKEFSALGLHLCGSDGASFPCCQYGKVMGTVDLLLGIPPPPGEDVLVPAMGLVLLSTY